MKMKAIKWLIFSKNYVTQKLECAAMFKSNEDRRIETNQDIFDRLISTW